MIINVIGGGTWGSTLAYLFSKKDLEVNLFLRDKDKAKSLNKTKKHPNLINFKLPENITISSNLSLIDINHLNIIAVPTKGINDVLKQINTEKGKYLIASKGFELKSGLLPYEVLNSVYKIDENRIAVLSGPNHAEEIIKNKATATVIGSINEEFSNQLQSLLSNNRFRVYTSKDILGIQLGAAVKNVIAIASGICVGLNMGDNTQAALVSRGMNEIARLGKIYKTSPQTLYGLSGLGDLICTCYSKHSRNREMGILISSGLSYFDAEKKLRMIAEGIHTSKVINDISKKYNIEMPICNEIYNILFKNNDPLDSLTRLMTRKLKVET